MAHKIKILLVRVPGNDVKAQLRFLWILPFLFLEAPIHVLYYKYLCVGFKPDHREC